MSAKYFFRLDDACPTMSKNWGRIEDIFDKYHIKPIVAVIPDNQDPEFFYERPRDDFWDLVKSWREKGWTIAMHGYRHLYETKNGGLVPIGSKSEFSGTGLVEQSEKIKNAWNIFLDNDICPAAWVAPGHSFDDNTLQAIKQETDIKIISDGISLRPFFEKGFFWIPQQLWKFRRLPFGTFTICLHPNTMTETDFINLERDLNGNEGSFIGVGDLPFNHRKKDIFDRIFMVVWWHVYARTRK